MPIDLYFAGATTGDMDEYLFRKNGNKLFNQKYERKSVAEPWIAHIRKNPDFTGKLFVDSSAYGAWTRGAQIDIDEYISWLNENAGSFSVIASLDVIPGTKGEKASLQQVKQASEESWANYLYMYERLEDRDHLIPVFHVGEPWDALHRILEYRHADGSPILYMGLGGLVGVSTKERERWLSKVWDIILSSSNASIKTHAFGVTTLSILETYPFTSADSTTYIRAAAMGELMSDGGRIKFGNAKVIQTLPQSARDAIMAIIKEYELNISLEDLASRYEARQMFNACYLLKWCDTHSYRAPRAKQNKLF